MAKKQLGYDIFKNMFKLAVGFLCGLLTSLLLYFTMSDESQTYPDPTSINVNEGANLLEWQRTIPRYPEFETAAIDTLKTQSVTENNCLELGVGGVNTPGCDFEKFPTDLVHANYMMSADTSNEGVGCLGSENVKSHKYDSIISLLSMHHLNLTEKRDLFETLFECLNDDGVFIYGDIITLQNKDMQQTANKIFAKHRQELLSPVELERFNTHSKEVEHTFYNLKETISLLEEVGFKSVDVVWMYYTMGVLRAQK